VTIRRVAHVIEVVKYCWIWQKNHVNGKNRTIKQNVDYPQLCQVTVAINIHLRLLCLGLKPDHPIAIY